jgi:hypothetical protein
LTSCPERMVVSEKIIEDNLSQVEKIATKSTYKLGVEFERCENKGEKSAPKFITSSNYHKEEETLKPTKTHYPSNPKSSLNPKREVRKETPSRERTLLFAYFMAVLVNWMSFASIARELRRDILIMLETHIVMSLLIFHLTLILVLCLVLLMLCLISFMDLMIAHMVLVYERTTLCLDVLVMAHILIMVIMPRVGMVSPLKGLTLTLSPNTWMVHVFPVVVHVPLVLRVKCKRL